MKKIKLAALLVLFCTAFTVTSCDNEPIDSNIDLGDFGNGGNTSPSNFKATFNGDVWNASVSQALISGNLIQISAVRPDGTSFGFLIDGSTTGTYPANDNILAYTPANSEFGYWSLNTANPTEDTGSITITNINTTNKTISGNFNFKGYWSDDTATGILPVFFTNGSFTNVAYVTQMENNDTFYAKVNGTEFVDVDILALELGINGQDYISVGGQDANLNSLTVSVRSNLGAGTYPITGNSTDVVQAIYDFSNTDYNAISGSVTIISKTATHIKGTFNVVTNGATPFTITQGAFDVEY